MGIVSTTLSLKIKLLNHIACDVISKHDTNFALVIEVATKDYFALLQEMAPPTNKKTFLSQGSQQSQNLNIQSLLDESLIYKLVVLSTLKVSHDLFFLAI